RDPAALETLDEPELPERVPAVERAAGDVADELGELARAARRRAADAVQGAAAVEVGILDEVRPVEAERHLAQLQREARRLHDALRDRLAQALDAEAGRARRIEDRERARVHVQRRGLEREEDRVRARKL